MNDKTVVLIVQSITAMIRRKQYIYNTVFVSGKAADSTVVIAIAIAVGVACVALVIIVIAVLIYCYKLKRRYRYTVSFAYFCKMSALSLVGYNKMPSTRSTWV